MKNGIISNNWFHSFPISHIVCNIRLTQSQVSALIVYINTLSINGGGTGSATRGVSKFINHQLFNRTSRTTHVSSLLFSYICFMYFDETLIFLFIQDNDIALLVLSSPVTTITPVKLPTDSQVITVKPTTKTTTKTTTTKTTTTKTTTRKPTTTMKTTTRKLTTAKPLCCAFHTRKSASPVFMRAFSTYANSPAVIAGWGSTTIGDESTYPILWIYWFL